MPAWMKWVISLIVGFALIVVGFKWAGWLLTTFFVMNCFVLIVVVLLQSGKAADLAGAFGGAGSQTAFGPRGAASVLSQATTWCAIMFMVCALALVVRVDRGVESGGSVLQQFAKPAAPAPKTATPAPAPASPIQSPQPTQQVPQTAPQTAPQSSTPAPAQQPKKP
jgi:preprotein translocase subunit SecG